jgi:hypothetical protein
VTAFIEVAKSAIRVYAHGTDRVVWSADLNTQNGKKQARKLAAEILWHPQVGPIDTITFQGEDGKEHTIPASAHLASRIAAVL